MEVPVEKAIKTGFANPVVDSFPSVRKRHLLPLEDEQKARKDRVISKIAMGS